MSKLDDLMNAEIVDARQRMSEIPSTVGCFRIQGANQCIAQARLQPDPKPLFPQFPSLWFDGQLCCLFAASNVGKSVLAVQIAAEIAKSQPVAYIDLEMDAKQFQRRYTDPITGESHKFADAFYRLELDIEAIAGASSADVLLSGIENLVADEGIGCKVVILDNMVWLSGNAEKGDEAADLMLKLKVLQRKYGLSLLILTHSPKRLQASPIILGDMAGSHKLSDTFDAVFCLGQSSRDPKIRYIKQLKQRSAPREYESDNVILCHLEKRDAMLQFAFDGFGDEAAHIKQLTQAESRRVARRLKEQGLSLSQIGKELNVCKSTAHNLVKDIFNESDNE